MNNIKSNTGEIVMYQPDETIRLEVRMGEETVWLSQAQMAELFQRDQSVIARHIRNIYKEEELDEEGTYAKFAYIEKNGVQFWENVFTRQFDERWSLYRFLDERLVFSGER